MRRRHTHTQTSLRAWSEVKNPAIRLMAMPGRVLHSCRLETAVKFQFSTSFSLLIGNCNQLNYWISYSFFHPFWTIHLNHTTVHRILCTTYIIGLLPTTTTTTTILFCKRISIVNKCVKAVSTKSMLFPYKRSKLYKHNAGHSIECITHAGHSIAFLNFSTL